MIDPDFKILGISLGDPDIRDLAISGVFGSLVRLMIDPEENWIRWVTQLFVGMLCAVFLGGVAAYFLDAGTKGLLACGFVFGSLGEHGLKMVQDRFATKKKK
jgi:hypothetical protein